MYDFFSLIFGSLTVVDSIIGHGVKVNRTLIERCSCDRKHHRGMTTDGWLTGHSDLLVYLPRSTYFFVFPIKDREKGNLNFYLIRTKCPTFSSPRSSKVPLTRIEYPLQSAALGLNSSVSTYRTKRVLAGARRQVVHRSHRESSSLGKKGKKRLLLLGNHLWS